MASFEFALGYLRPLEGEYVHDPRDPGGETYRGIARKRQRAWAGWRRIDGHKRGLPDNPSARRRAMNARLAHDATLQGMVRSFYRKYWEARYGNYARLHDQNLANRVFAAAVNMGRSRAIKALQNALRANGQYHLIVDGRMGRRTLTAVHTSSQDGVLTAFRSELAAVYRLLAARNPNLRRFLRGWLIRAYK